MFDFIERKYNDTKPVNGKRRSKEYDLRPLNKRANTSERIIKFSDDEYGVLSDDLHGYDPVRFPAESHDTYRAACCLRVRRLDDQGLCLVHIQISRKWLITDKRVLNQLLRGTATVKTKDTKEFVRLHRKGEEYYVPRSLTNINNYIYVVGKKQPAPPKIDKADKTLTFLCKDGEYTLSSEPHIYNKIVVNKELKEKYRKGIAAYISWVFTVMPMDEHFEILTRDATFDYHPDWRARSAAFGHLNQLKSKTRREMGESVRRELREHVETVTDNIVSYTEAYHYLVNRLEGKTITRETFQANNWMKEQVRSMFLAAEKGEDHWLMYPLYKSVLMVICNGDIHRDDEGYKKIRTRFNLSMNRVAEFYTEVEA